MSEKAKKFEMQMGLEIVLIFDETHFHPTKKFDVEYRKYGELLTTDTISYSDKECDIKEMFNASLIALLDNEEITIFSYNSFTMNMIISYILSS